MLLQLSHAQGQWFGADTGSLNYRICHFMRPLVCLLNTLASLIILGNHRLDYLSPDIRWFSSFWVVESGIEMRNCHWDWRTNCVDCDWQFRWEDFSSYVRLLTGFSCRFPDFRASCWKWSLPLAFTFLPENRGILQVVLHWRLITRRTIKSPDREEKGYKRDII